MIVEFHRRGSGRIEVMMGVQLVGVIEPWDDMQRGMGKIEAYHWVTLNHDGRRKPASTIASARCRILRDLAEWFDAAGLSDVAVSLHLQAENEQSACQAPSLFPRRIHGAPR